MTEQNDQDEQDYIVKVSYDEPDGGVDEIIGTFSSKDEAEDIAGDYRKLLTDHKDYYLNDRFGFADSSHQFRVFVFPVPRNTKPVLPVRVYIAYVATSEDMLRLLQTNSYGITPVLVDTKTLEPFMRWSAGDQGWPDDETLRNAIDNPQSVFETTSKIVVWNYPADIITSSITVPTLVSLDKNAIIKALVEEGS